MKRQLICLALIVLPVGCGPREPDPVRTAQIVQAATLADDLVTQADFAVSDERRLGDDSKNRIRDECYARIRTLSGELEASPRGGEADLLRQLKEARAEAAALAARLAERDPEWMAERLAYRAETRQAVLLSSSARQLALRRFADGDRTGAWPEIERLTLADIAARHGADKARDAAAYRELARLRAIMAAYGEAKTESVLAWWQKAADLKPDDHRTQIEIARLTLDLDIERDSGKLASAKQAAKRALQLARDVHERDAALDTLGEVSDRQTGGSEEAAGYYREGLRIAEGLVAAAPNDARAQRSLYVSLIRMGGVSGAQRPVAIGYYRRALKVAEARVAADPQSPETRRELSAAINRLSWPLRWEDPKQAARDLRRSVDIARKLASESPGLVLNQIDFAVALENLGSVLAMSGGEEEALTHFSQGIRLCRGALRSDPNNAAFKRLLATLLTGKGDVEDGRKLHRDAAASFAQALRLRKELAGHDVTDARAGRDVALAFDRVCGIQVKLGELDAALGNCREGLGRWSALARADRGTAAKLDLAISFASFGDVLEQKRDMAGAMRAYEQARAIVAALPRDADTKSYLGEIDTHLGKLRAASARGAGR